MKNLKLITSLLMILALVFSSGSNLKANAATVDRNIDCDYTAVSGVNPDYQTIDCLLTEAALKYDVPPEIVKAIAEIESDWRQFDSNGQPFTSTDNGIGIMQITNQSSFDQNRLKTDIVYNIEAGVQILNNMFQRTDLPSINEKNRRVIEHWYFAVMAYNGTKPVNSPIVQATGVRNLDAYQEKVFAKIESAGLLDLASLPFKSSDFSYDSNSDANIKFVTMKYDFDVDFTKSKHYFYKDQNLMTASSVNLRSQPSTDGTPTGLKAGELLTVTGPFVHEERAAGEPIGNHFVWYPVKTASGKTGYVASSYLELNFTDVSENSIYSEPVLTLADYGVVRGYSDGTFKLGSNITRAEAAVMLANLLDLDVENAPAAPFSDVKQGVWYSGAINALYAADITSGVTETTYGTNSKITRAQLASMLVRAYKLETNGNPSLPFTDLKAGAWYVSGIKTLYSHGLISGTTPTTFSPDSPMKRGDFSLLAYNTEMKYGDLFK